jgi:threonyl-tRNA synthetase
MILWVNKLGKGNFGIKEKDGAFYGPKLDIQVTDSIGREWQCGTIQLDFQLAGRFNCVYTDKDGQKKTPIIIHRVIYGSLGRFIGVMLEHLGGKLPIWLAPAHAVIIPISDQYDKYAEDIAKKLHDVEVRTATPSRQNGLHFGKYAEENPECAAETGSLYDNRWRKGGRGRYHIHTKSRWETDKRRETGRFYQRFER